VRRIALTAAATAALLPALSSSVAHADYAGPDDTLASANPIVAGTAYTGALNSPSDLDDFAFNVTSAGTELLFAIRNTTATCNSPVWLDDDCVMYATLVDSNGNQLGGEGSTAGTGPLGYAGTDYSTDTIDWTFNQPGRYYLIVEGNGVDESGETPSYALGFDRVSAYPGGGGSGTGGTRGTGGTGGTSGTGATSGGAIAPARVQILTRRVSVHRSRVAIRLRCVGASGRCTGTLTLSARALGAGARGRLGRPVRFALAAGTTRTVRVRLTRRALARVSRRHPLHVQALAAQRGIAKPARASVLVY
jgi:hypothetical protein